MEKKDRDLIVNNSKELVKRINLDLLMSLLLRETKTPIFTTPMLEDILEQQTETDKKEMLLMELPTRGPHAFQKFVEALKLSGNNNAAHLLDRNCLISDNNEQVSTAFTDNAHQGTTGISADSHVIVKPATSWKCGEGVYKMNSTPRGCCLIINNVVFRFQKNREGSNVDETRLKNVFIQLGYDVYPERNLDGDQMLDKMASFSKKFEHWNVDSCVVIILSHGKKDYVLGCDNKYVALNDIYELFNNETSPWLQGKPKLFFIQACRGETPDIGATIFSMRESTDALDVIVPDSVPAKAKKCQRIATVNDTLISFSTVEGYISLRNHKFGTWYCLELALALCEHAHNLCLVEILKKVDKKVQERCSEDGEKQATEWILRGFNKSLYFNPGLTST